MVPDIGWLPETEAQGWLCAPDGYISRDQLEEWGKNLQEIRLVPRALLKFDPKGDRDRMIILW